MSKAKSNFVITHPKKTVPEGQIDDLQFGMVTLNKKISDVQEQLRDLTLLPGVDLFQVVGIYTFQVTLANTFDFEEVWHDIRIVLDVVTSAIVIAGAFKK